MYNYISYIIVKYLQYQSVLSLKIAMKKFKGGFRVHKHPKVKFSNDKKNKEKKVKEKKEKAKDRSVVDLFKCLGSFINFPKLLWTRVRNWMLPETKPQKRARMVGGRRL